MKTKSFAAILLSLAGFALFDSAAQAAIAVKQSTGTDLTGTTAGVWVGGSGPNGSPAATDIASWTNSSLGAGLTLEASESWGGISVSNALSDIYLSGTGTLTNGASGIDLSASTVNMTIANPVVLSASQTWAVNGGMGLTNEGGVSGAFSLTKTGAGTLSLSGSNTYSGATAVSAGTLAVGSMSLASATAANLASGSILESAGTLSLVASGSINPSINITGAGTLELTATTNSASSPDIYFNPNDTLNSGANWGCQIAAPIKLGSSQRYIWGKTDHNSVDHYDLTGTDCQFGGGISGAGGLTFVAQDANTASTPNMETPFALNASNSFTGPMIIERGSVYLGAANAFPSGDQLVFNVGSGNNGKFFLYGQNATVSDLSSIGAGNALIANGDRNPSTVGSATLTVVENMAETFSGSILDTNAEGGQATEVGASTVLNLVVTGSGALTLAGTDAYSGTTIVSNGTLIVSSSLAGGAVTVQNGGTFGGNGTINGPVSVQTGSTLMTSPSGISTLTINNTLNLAGNVSLRINSSSSTSDLLQGMTSVTYGGTLTVTDLGNALALGSTFTLFNGSSYNGGFNSLVLPSLPTGLSWNVSQLTVNGSISVVNSAATPAFNPPGGSYVGTQPITVTISSLTPGATIYYTTNGTAPTSSSLSGISPVTVIVPVNTNLTLQAYSVAAGYTSSGVASATYLTETKAVWTDLSGGSWSVASNWTNNIIPNNSGATADFSTLTLPSSANVTLDGNWTVGDLIFGDVGNNYTWQIGSGSGGVLTLASTGSPTITVSNQAATVTAVLAGTQGLTEAGAGTLTLSGANTYSGPTIINAGGNLQIGDPGVLGGGVYSSSINNNGALTYDSTSAQALNGNIAGAGVLVLANSGALTLNGINTYAGGTVLSNEAAALNLGNGSALGSGPLDLSQDGFGVTLTAANNSPVTFSNNIVLAAAGVTDTIVKNSAGATVGTPLSFSGNISGGSSSTILFLNSSTSGDTTTTYQFNGSNTFIATINVNRGSLVAGSPSGLGDPSNLIYLDSEDGPLGDLRFAISMSLTNTIQIAEDPSTISTETNNVTLVGPIIGSDLQVLGTGKLVLAANNSYGATTVSGGTLEVDGSTGSGAVTISTNSVVDGMGTISGGVTVNTGGLLTGSSSISGAVVVNGTLSGHNTINAPVTINTSGILACGTNPVAGTLTIDNTLILNAGSTNLMRISKTGGTPASDQITGLTQINFAGTLVVSNLTAGTPLANGDTFTLFNSSSYSGNFQNLVLPALPAGLSWNVSRLPVNGTIAVVNTAAVPVFNPPAGGYVGAQIITISTLTPNATIYYTTNGTVPTSSSPSGAAPVTVLIPASTNITIQAYTVASGYTASAVVSATYTTEPRAIWTDASSGSWSIASNWTNNIIPNNSGATVDFSQLTLGGNMNVTLDGTWTAGNLIFGDQGNSYTWEIDPGSGAPLTLVATNLPTITVSNQTATITAVLAGTNGLRLTGAGLLTLSGVNTYSGPTSIGTNSTFQIGDPGTLGAGTYNDVITNNGVILYNSTSAQTFTGDMSGIGAVIVANSGALTLNGINTYSGGTVLSNAASLLSSLTIGNGNALGSGPVDFSQASSGVNFTVANTGAVVVSNNIVLSTAAVTDTVVKNAGGTPVIFAGNISGGSSSTILYLNSNQGGDSTTTFLFNGSNTFLATINLNRGSLVASSPFGLGDPSNLIYLDSEDGSLGDMRFAISMTLTNPIQLVLDENTISTETNDVTLVGPVSGNDLQILGTGTMIFSSANTSGNNYGATIVEGGTLEVDCSLSSTAVTVASTATLDGTSTINAPVTVNAGGTVAAGDASATGILTIANTLSLGVNSGDVTYSRFSVGTGGNISAASLALTGTNVVNILNTSLTVGTNNLINYSSENISSLSGFVLGTLPPGTTAHLLDSGSAIQLAVTAVSTVNTSSPVMTNTLSGKTLTLSWPAGHLGWRLEVQTNSLTTGLDNNWFTVPNSTSVTSVSVTVNPTNPTVFYRLVYP